MQQGSVTTSLVKMGVAIFITYLAVALAMPVVAVYVNETLQMPNWLSGAAVGSSFVATILSRKWAGRISDERSSKRCFMTGFWFYVMAALTGLIAANITNATVSFVVLVVSRLLLGIGESFTTVGLPSWHFSRLGAIHSGKILAVFGMAMYGAFALGGPLGLALYQQGGFAAAMLVSALLPLVGATMFYGAPEAAVAAANSRKTSFGAVLRTIWQPGLVVLLQGVGFAVLGAFVSLYFREQGWPFAGVGLSLFGLGFVASRILFGALPDKIGGVRVAFTSLLVETAGQSLLWLAPQYEWALLGALLTGLGCSMIYPAMGVEVIKRVRPEQRSTAFGAFALFQDAAYAFSAPLAGVLADAFGYSTVFLFGLTAAVGGLVAVGVMQNERRLVEKSSVREA